MEDENSQDVVPIDDATTEVESDFPLMMLFNRLIGNENKQNTVLSNAQILDILEKEFHMNTSELHELEMDIYLSVMKKFLKDWPQWDEFDGAINKLKQANNQVEMQKMLDKKYHQLKNYLSIMLDIARPRAKDKVKEAEEKYGTQEVEKDTPEEDLSDVMLEIHSSRLQLNNLFFNQPHPEQNYSIFNVTDSKPSKICLEVPDYSAILNWWNVSIIFKTSTIHLVRSTVHDVKHMLVNKKLDKKDKIIKLKSGYQTKAPYTVKQSELKPIEKSVLVKLLRKLYASYDETDYKTILEVIYSVFEKDFVGLPNEVLEMVSYRKYFCRHPYVRHLSTQVSGAENDTEAMKYDLSLKEVISPMFQFDITKIEPVHLLNTKSADLRGIQLECKSCTLKFSGVTMLEQLKQHVLENHLNEPDWQCMKCLQSFTMVNLAKSRWSHDCKEKLT